MPGRLLLRQAAMIYADQRWIGNHGIGRFARHVLAGLQYRSVALTTHPAAPLDAWRLTRALKQLKPDDLFFSPGYNTPLACNAPFIFTIHDLSPVYCPENSSRLKRLYYATFLKRACRRAAKILTVSEFSRQSIIEWAGVSSEKVVNVSCGVDQSYRPDGESYAFPFPYLLCVSNRRRHKNEFRLVQAFAKADLDPKLHLALTGNSTPAIANHIEQHELSSRVNFTGPVPEEKLPSLYRGAEALIFPSLYEGFGLPILEAMACGAPVVTSNLTSMPEVAGGAALLVDPTSIDQLSTGIVRILNDASLRSRLREKGFRRAAQFSWASTAALVRELLIVTGTS